MSSSSNLIGVESGVDLRTLGGGPEMRTAVSFSWIWATLWRTLPIPTVTVLNEDGPAVERVTSTFLVLTESC